MTLPVNVHSRLFMMLCIAVTLLTSSYGTAVAWEADNMPDETATTDQRSAETAVDAAETPATMPQLPQEDAPVGPVQSSVVYYDSLHHLMPGNSLVAIPRSKRAGNEWMIYPVLICFMLLALGKLFYPAEVRMLIHSVFNLRFFIRTDKKYSILSERASYLLKLNYLLCLSLLIMQTLLSLEIMPPWMQQHPVLTHAGIFLAAALFYVLKHLLISYIGWLFDARMAARAYYNNIFVFNHVVGILLLPLLLYQALNPLVYVLIAAWMLIAAFNLLRVIRGVILGRLHRDFSVYYLFLYLCGVELAPLLMLGKAASVLLF